MKGFSRVVLLLCLVLAALADAAGAQTNAPSRDGRQYNRRIQMHTTPITLQVPDGAVEMQRSTASQPSDFDLLVPETLPQESQFRPAGPRIRAPQEKQQNKNWILPAAPEKDREEEDQETKFTPQEDSTSSGWGWLADDMRARQQRQEESDDKKDDESKEKENEYQPRSALPKDNKTKNGGTVLNTVFKPVSSSPSTRDRGTSEADSDSEQDEYEETRKERGDGPTTIESPRNRTSADSPSDRKFGADAAWGNESLWNKTDKPVSRLPQTEALLSHSKIDARNPLNGWNRPELKPDVKGGAMSPTQPKTPEPARRDLVTAVGFQPLPTTPVNDLSSTPWGDGGAPGKTPFGASAPYSPAPATAPSQPFESLKAPELQKPAASPWLK